MPRHPAAAEWAGWGAALVLSAGVVAVVSTVSADLLYTDGDSLVVAMIVRSLAAGQPQDWAMSPVLFLPEIVVFAGLWLLGLGARATLTLAALVNLLALYAALRVVTGRRGPGRAPVWGAVAAFAVVAVLGLLEGPATRDGPQFVTLFATTTYYSATVVAMMLALGIVRRSLDRGAATPWRAAVLLAGIAAVSVLSNPLFAAWLTLPAVLVLAAAAALRRVAARAAMLLASGLLAGSVAGYAARGILADVIVAQGGNYLHFGELGRSAVALARALAAAAGSVHGAAWLIVVVVLVVGSVLVLARAWRAGETPVAIVAAVAVIGPPLLTVGAFAVGADAARYLQPWVFLPLAALACAVPPPPRRLRESRPARIGAAVAALAVLAVAFPVATDAATTTDRDLDCVTDWVERSSRTGAGQFWTVRAPQLALADPARLVQVDHTLRVYTWLTNRAAVEVDEVNFLVADAGGTAWDLPRGLSPGQALQIGCGRYTILDFGSRQLPLGPPRA